MIASDYNNEMRQIVTDVFNSMLGIEVAPGQAQSVENPVSAAIQFEGTWSGSALLECSLSQSFELTHRLLNVDRPAEFDENVSDAMGELANMIGGNLKALLPPKVLISVPKVTWPADSHLGAEECSSSTIYMNSEVGAFSMTLIGRS